MNDTSELTRLFGERCAELRIAKGLSEEDAAWQLDTSVDRLRAIEAGDCGGVLVTGVVRIAALYEVHLGYFFGGPKVPVPR